MMPNGQLMPRDRSQMVRADYLDTDLQPSLTDEICRRKGLWIGIMVALVIAAIVSAIVVRPHFEDPKAWSSCIEVIDQKKDNVLALTTSCIALSGGISALPGDTGTPVATQLTQLAGNLGIVLAVLYLEKYLLTVISTVALGFLVPLACVLFAVALGMHGRWTTSCLARVAAVRILLIAVIGMAVVPASVWVTQQIDSTYSVSAEQKEVAAQADQAAADKKAKKSKKSESTENKNIFEQLADGVAGVVDDVTSGAKKLTDGMVAQVNQLIEGTIVMIVTSCLIPILVLVAFLWLGHTLLGIDVSAPAGALARRLCFNEQKHSEKDK